MFDLHLHNTPELAVSSKISYGESGESGEMRIHTNGQLIGHCLWALVDQNPINKSYLHRVQNSLELPLTDWCCFFLGGLLIYRISKHVERFNFHFFLHSGGS